MSTVHCFVRLIFGTLPPIAPQRRPRFRGTTQHQNSVIAAQRAKQQFIFLTQEKPRFAWLRPFAIRPQCLRALATIMLCDTRLYNDTFCTSSFAHKRILLFVTYSFWKWYSCTGNFPNILGAKAQQSLFVDILVIHALFDVFRDRLSSNCSVSWVRRVINHWRVHIIDRVCWAEGSWSSGSSSFSRGLGSVSTTSS